MYCCNVNEDVFFFSLSIPFLFFPKLEQAIKNFFFHRKNNN